MSHQSPLPPSAFESRDAYHMITHMIPHDIYRREWESMARSEDSYDDFLGAFDHFMAKSSAEDGRSVSEGRTIHVGYDTGNTANLFDRYNVFGRAQGNVRRLLRATSKHSDECICGTE